MKKIFFVLAFFFLSSCGVTKVSPTSQSPLPEGIERFTVLGTSWQIILGEGWQKVPNSSADSILSAYKGTQNLKIVQKVGDASRVAGSIVGTAKDLYFFKEVSVTPFQWQFQAKLLPSDPLRTYVQKVFSVPNSGFFLLASCSYETDIEKNPECVDLLDSFQVLVDKK